MATFGAKLLLALALTSCAWGRGVKQPGTRDVRFDTQMPEPDGNLNMYMLPTGQGDSQIIQCPDGTLSIIDLGRGFSENDPKFWQPNDILVFLSGKLDRIRNILVTHNHWDHYILLPDTFTGISLPGVENMYITCQPEHMHSRLQEWVVLSNLEDKLRMFNNGAACGPNGESCGNLDLCPGHAQITAPVLAVNLGQNCVSGSKNMDSILFKFIWGGVSVLMPGDFEDATTNWEEQGPQRAVVDYYGAQMQSTVYKISHHGASRLANKPFFRDAIQPKAVFATANPAYSNYRHPRCISVEGYTSLCRPGENNVTSGEYCGEHTHPSLPVDQRVQSTYICGGSSTDEFFTRNSNQHAIYTTTPDIDSINLVKFSTDGTRWGFTVDIHQPPF